MLFISVKAPKIKMTVPWEVPEGRVPAKLLPRAEGGAKRELGQKAELVLVLFLGLQHHSQCLVVIETGIKATV